MPAPSPNGPASDSVFASSGDLATEISRAADADVATRDPLHNLDPDQVEGERAGKRLGPVFWIAVTVFAVIALAAILAPWLPLKSHTVPVGRPSQPPSSQFWMGTDSLGRDIFSRAIWGGRVSLQVGFASILFGLFFGGIVGVIAGYRRGRTETVLMGAMDVLLSFPSLLLALSIVSFTDNREWWLVSIAIGIVAIAPIARLVRANTLVYSQREFVMAARSLGASTSRIIFKEIIPNVVFPVMSYAIILVAVAIVGEAALAYLGLSVRPPIPTWGGMIADGRPKLENAPWISLMPCLVLFVTVLALNLAGDRIRGYFDSKEGGL